MRGSVPEEEALPAAPVNVHALKATMNAEPPTIHHSAFPPPRK